MIKFERIYTKSCLLGALAEDNRRNIAVDNKHHLIGQVSGNLLLFLFCIRATHFDYLLCVFYERVAGRSNNGRRAQDNIHTTFV